MKFTTTTEAYKLLKSISGSNFFPSILSGIAETATSDAPRAELFNYYFCSVYQQKLRLDAAICVHEPDVVLVDVSFTVEDVQLALSQVPDTSSQSSDDITGKVLRYGSK